jgi:magnesium chelatase accessory protein
VSRAVVVASLPDGWPLRSASRFHTVDGLRWHVQKLGAGPAVLLLHGTGAATHTWRELAPRLAERFTVIAPDLPAHGFTARPADDRDLSMAGMARALQALLRRMRIAPVLGVGHSAGAALLARMCLDRRMAPLGIASLNGALLELPGLPRVVFAPMARLLAANPLVPRLFAWRARDRAAVERLVASTGSRLDTAGIEQYARLVSDPEHVAGALGMMAQWNLGALERDLPRLSVPLLLVVGGSDRTLPPSEAKRVQRLLPAARIVELAPLGHLAHEEQPAAVARLIVEFAARCGALQDATRASVPDA